MNEMQVFQNSEFGELGVLEIEGKPYFPAKAAAKMLGYKDTINAIKQHCKGVVKHHLPIRPSSVTPLLRQASAAPIWCWRPTNPFVPKLRLPTVSSLRLM